MTLRSSNWVEIHILRRGYERYYQRHSRREDRSRMPVVRKPDTRKIELAQSKALVAYDEQEAEAQKRGVHQKFEAQDTTIS